MNVTWPRKYNGNSLDWTTAPIFPSPSFIVVAADWYPLLLGLQPTHVCLGSDAECAFMSPPGPSAFQATGLHFRHTDNVIQWLNAMAEIGLPKVMGWGRIRGGWGGTRESHRAASVSPGPMEGWGRFWCPSGQVQPPSFPRPSTCPLAGSSPSRPIAFSCFCLLFALLSTAGSSTFHGTSFPRARRG